MAGRLYVSLPSVSVTTNGMQETTITDDSTRYISEW